MLNVDNAYALYISTACIQIPCRLEMKPVDIKDELRGLESTSTGGSVLCAIL